MKRTQDTPAPVPGPSYTLETENETPDISSHESEYDPDATPSRAQSRPKGKGLAYRGQSEDDESDSRPSLNMLLDIIRRQEERLRAFEIGVYNTAGLPQMESLTSRPAEELIQKQVDRFEKKAQSTLSARTKVQLRPNNYTEWHESFLVDAEAIKARDILDERQQKPPAGLSNLDTAIWHAKYDDGDLRGRFIS
jgi:hypothetical protein